MTSPEERREVAARLRELDYTDLQESLICAYLDALGIEGYMDWIGIAHRIADLIEPDNRTCHMRDTIWDDGQCTWGCICSECGARHEHTRGEWLNYCPNCGARVTEKEGE